jgi:hypothetical protein
MDEGHCGLPVEELVALTEKLLEVTAELVETALNLELEGGAVIADDLEGRRCVFLAALYRAEREIAEKLKTLAAGKPLWPSIDVERVIPWVEQRTKLALADSQKAALRVAAHLKSTGDHRRVRRWENHADQLPLNRKPGSLLTPRWRRESGANPSLKWGFSPPGNYGIPKPLWTIIVAEKGYFGLENGGVSVFAPWQLPPLSGS